ncbi:uncharacterized protein LOC127699849 isoform X1 [Mytilus californianus]|uniref:uncharacterized protein LOC127699849 isoform X1 n=1 Tax=Mytilus californianus TaxID=6549 RepID=UPI0022477670|nr:uncharacterized protein LOC127699849 isoform X1 [Mytilus californianus]
MADIQFCVGCQCRDEDMKAVSSCSDCSELVCKTCARVHERMLPANKIVPMKEIQQLISSFLEMSENCDNHPDQKIVLYCCQHDKVICDSCVPASHQNCKPIISVEKAAKGVKDSTAISDLERRMENLSQVTEKILSQNETTLEDLKNIRNNIKKRVSEMKQRVIGHLDKLEADIYKDIDNKYKQCNDTISRNKDSARSSTDSLSTWKSDLKSLKQHASEIHLFQVVKFLDVKTHQKELKIRELQIATVPTLTYHPLELESNVKAILLDFGNITIDNVPVPKPVLDLDQQSQVLVRAQGDKRKLSLTNSFQTTKLGNGVCILRGCFFPGNRLLLCQYSGSKLFACKLDGSNYKEINLNFEPKYITLYRNKHAIVSQGNGSVQIIDLTSLRPSRMINVGGTCEGITSFKDKIWVKNERNTLTIVDINGKVLNTIHTKFDPWVICANNNGDVYCTDNFSNKVFVVTSDGKEREIYKSPDLTITSAVAVDDRGDVYVAGRGSNNIHRISNDGQKHDIVLTADDGIYQPIGLSYNCETRELLVVNNYNNIVNIYKIQ